jgi:hypothetical protein
MSMMRIHILVAPAANPDLQIDHVYELDEAEAWPLIDAGYAEPVLTPSPAGGPAPETGGPAPETATLAADPETATLPKGRRRAGE